MSTIFNGFLDNLISGALNPKGNLGDWRHASRTFVKNTYRLAPKVKFLYHVFFDISEDGRKINPRWDQRHKRELGLLVKSSTLPEFTANVETRKKYNRVRHAQSSIQYNPVSITFHDDNMGITTGLLEMYMRYYFADTNVLSGGANIYSKTPALVKDTKATTMRQGPAGTSAPTSVVGQEIAKPTLSAQPSDLYRDANHPSNQSPFGMDNRIKSPFFNNIQISLMTRNTYTTYFLVNPLITDWSHGDVTAGDSQGVENKITFKYEAMQYQRGKVDSNVAPAGFGAAEHYDQTPSPITLAGGAVANFGTILSGAADLFDYAATGESDVFNNPIGAALAGFNLLRSGQGLSAEGVLNEGVGALTGILENSSRDEILGGISDTVFPGE